MSRIKENFKQNKLRIILSIFITILGLRISYYREELSFPPIYASVPEYFFMIILQTFFLFLAWFWGYESFYNKMVLEANFKKPIKYKTWNNLGTLLIIFVFIIYFIISFVFPVPLTPGYGR